MSVSSGNHDLSCTVRNLFADFAVFDLRYCKAVCDVKLSPIEGYGRTFRHAELLSFMWLNFITVCVRCPYKC